jgi:hypothetical protein
MIRITAPLLAALLFSWNQSGVAAPMMTTAIPVADQWRSLYLKTSSNVSIISGQVQAYNPSDEVQVPFSLTRVPSAAQLQFQIIVSTKGSCPTTYYPTTFKINDQLVQEVDFRPWPVKSWRQLTLAVPANALRVGGNVLQIKSGSCQYGFDRITLNNVQLLEQ